MNFHVLTLFPELVETIMKSSITGRAMDKGIISLHCVNIRDFAPPKRKGRVDDYPFGGGAGMVIEPEPVYAAWRSVASERVAPECTLQEPYSPEVCEQSGEQDEISCSRKQDEVSGDKNYIDKADGETRHNDLGKHRIRTVYLTPQGRVFNQQIAMELAQEEEICFLCGHYEGIDERVIEEIVTDEISIGDYVLTGGEVPACVVMDAVARMVPGVLSNDQSGEEESFMNGLLEYPQYTRPAVWHDKEVPPILLSGHHANVEAWRREQSLRRTARKRPDLLEHVENSMEQDL